MASPSRNYVGANGTPSRDIVDTLRCAVDRIEKNGRLTPLKLDQAWHAATFRPAA